MRCSFLSVFSSQLEEFIVSIFVSIAVMGVFSSWVVSFIKLSRSFMLSLIGFRTRFTRKMEVIRVMIMVTIAINIRLFRISRFLDFFSMMIKAAPK